MKIKVNIPDELAEQAKARGLDVHDYVEELLAQRVNVRSNAQQTRTLEEIRGWLDALAQFSDKVPPLPEIISREWIYQDRD